MIAALSPIRATPSMLAGFREGIWAFPSDGWLHSCAPSTQGSCREAGQFRVLCGIGNLDRITADFAILHVRLLRGGQVEHHRNLFAAIRTGKEVFHSSQSSAASFRQQRLPRARRTRASLATISRAPRIHDGILNVVDPHLNDV